ncbi:tryptophan-associated transmembrane protein [Diaminobutyricimonas aerilata]|uniref:Tryptophan-associated transmembrane protein n=1 Tax=Diaminobutyricimonas aerilata TaxID=1162967 RepID=A0A2M9CK43_9MICO|nr:Trp biosynthesis-associated membrane protein [Diaminobutyricimonas aerilata]PJJ72266.1 tryptophan-associated transmembrane protein [Diaminobutyricimonas aerilata]
MTPARLKGSLLAAIAVVDGLALLSWTQTWFEVALDDGAVTVAGDQAAPALAAFGLAGLALVAALALAGPFFRFVLGALQAVLAGCVLLSAGLALGAPVRTVAGAVTEQTGVAGTDAVLSLIASVQPTAWPAVTIAVGILGVLAGLAVAATARRWPGQTRRFSRMESADAPRGAVDDWDALTGGDDPTGDATPPEDPRPAR